MQSYNFVCVEHFTDPVLAEAVIGLTDRDPLTGHACDFCVHPIPGADLDDVAEFVSEAIHRHYETAADAGMPWDQEDGCWAFSTTDTTDVVWGLGGIETAEVVDAIVERLEPEDWVPQNDPMRSEAEVLRGSWVAFQEHVMHVSRFLMAPAIVEAIRDEVELIEVVQIGTPVYRARSFDGPLPFRKPHQLVGPPASLSRAGRMNAAGIPVLYAAMDAETAAAEVFDGKEYAALIELRTLEELTVLNLTEPPWHSPFDPQVSLRRYRLASFLRSFAQEITRPIVRDERVHHEYVPAQMMSEFLRWRLLPTGRELDGIKYRSSRGEAANIVLFVGPLGCLPDSELGEQVSRGHGERQKLRPGSNVLEIRQYLPPRSRELEPVPLELADE
jgi:hypothetical protein